ncbi:cytochrome b5 domain-containing protein 1 isoform 1-T1 [Vipera latastei]
MESSSRPRFFTPREVAVHNRPWDLWVSYLGRVYDLSPLAEENRGDLLMKPLLEVAGRDISHWFNPRTKDIQTHIDPLTGCLKYYTPQGRFVHIPPPLPRSDWANDFGVPWWKNPIYEIGILSAKTRHIRIINTLTSQEQTLEGPLAWMNILLNPKRDVISERLFAPARAACLEGKGVSEGEEGDRQPRIPLGG